MESTATAEEEKEEEEEEEEEEEGRIKFQRSKRIGRESKENRIANDRIPKKKKKSTQIAFSISLSL